MTATQAHIVGWATIISVALIVLLIFVRNFGWVTTLSAVASGACLTIALIAAIQLIMREH